MQLTNRRGHILCILISILFLGSFYSKNILHPNEYIFTASNDGLKTYYNFVWHGCNDSSFFELNGMNYPYGEFILFEDSLPLFNTLKKILSNIWPTVNTYSVGILNILIFLSFVIGAMFMYLIFTKFTLPPIISAIGANAVILFSTQITLLSPIGHLALVFICFFAMGWYLILIHFENQHKIKWSFLIAVNILLWAFTHIYLGFILVFFLIGVHLLRIFFKRLTIKDFKTALVHIGIQIVVPVILILTLYKLYDIHLDRIDMPFLLDHKASFHTVFLSNSSPFKPVYNVFFNTYIINEQTWGEVGNYIGLSSNIAILLFCILGLLYFFQKFNTNPFNYLPMNMGYFLGSAILLLLFSMAIPTQFIPLSIINYFSILKQFFTLGRFAWAFYFVITTASIAFLYKYIMRFSKGYILFYLLLACYFAEAIPYHLKVSKISSLHKNPFVTKYLSDDEKVLLELNNVDFQAIIPLPYYFKFNLPFYCDHTDESIYASMVASVHSGLPILSVYLSRPSVTEGLNIFKLFNPSPYQKIIPELLSDGRDLAIVLYNADTLILENNAKSILKKATLLKRSAKYSIYSITLSQFFCSTELNKITDLKTIQSGLLQKEGCFVSDTNQFILHKDFENLKSDVQYFGNGAYMGKKADYNVICTFSTANLDTLQEYIVSFWYYNHIWDQTFNTGIVAEADSSKKNIQWLPFSPIETSIIDGWWYFSEFSFKPLTMKGEITFMFKGGNEFLNWFSIDELLVRPSELNVYRFDNRNDTTFIFMNNRLTGFNKLN